MIFIMSNLNGQIVVLQIIHSRHDFVLHLGIFSFEDVNPSTAIRIIWVRRKVANTRSVEKVEFLLNSGCSEGFLHIGEFPFRVSTKKKCGRSLN